MGHVPRKSLVLPRSDRWLAVVRGGHANEQRSRRALSFVAVVLIVAGLLVRSVPGALGDVGGGILYAVLIFLLVAVVAPAASAPRIGAISFGVCAAVELPQLTGLPSLATEMLPPLRFVLGTTFVASDLIAYAGGTVGAVLVDRTLGPRLSRSAPA
jgi:hypothetical protein